jgi:uncharacterized protein (DUF1501 family)
MSLTRRQFVALTAPAMVAFGSARPHFLANAAEQAKHNKQEKILVVVQMSGGNDGLNTVVPFNNEEYKKARPTLALSESEVLKIDDELGFHPAAKGFNDLLQENQLAVVQGVGYPNPNLSHFESMDIWHTCLRKSDNRPDGWLGRTVDSLQLQSKSDIPALHLGHRKQPYALVSRDYRIPSVKSLQQFRLELQQRESLNEIRNGVTADRPASSSLLNFVQTSTGTAIDVSQKLADVTKSYKTDVTYPETALGTELKTVAQLIDADLSTRIFYVEIEGFDTHSQQADAHAALLRQVGDAISSFTEDLNQHGHGDRVLTMCFSEFGRRVQENASKGTDHGRAAPLFLAGNQVNSGILGKQPSLNDLEQGDLKHHTDFRQVYATILQDWLKTPTDKILNGNFKPLDIIQS